MEFNFSLAWTLYTCSAIMFTVSTAWQTHSVSDTMIAAGIFLMVGAIAAGIDG